MDVSVLAEAVELTEHRVPYVLATVVWRRGPFVGAAGLEGRRPGRRHGPGMAGRRLRRALGSAPCP